MYIKFLGVILLQITKFVPIDFIFLTKELILSWGDFTH